MTASRAFELPDSYSTGNAWAVLSAAERFGQLPGALMAMPPAELAVLIAYDRFRHQQEARARAELRP